MILLFVVSECVETLFMNKYSGDPAKTILILKTVQCTFVFFTGSRVSSPALMMQKQATKRYLIILINC